MSTFYIQTSLNKVGQYTWTHWKKVEQIHNFIAQNRSLTNEGINIKIKDDWWLFPKWGSVKKSGSNCGKEVWGSSQLSTIIQLKAVMEDFRIHKLGGIGSRFDIFKWLFYPQSWIIHPRGWMPPRKLSTSWKTFKLFWGDVCWQCPTQPLSKP